MPSLAACRREIEALHAFFVRWYCGRAARAAFDRVEHALGNSFERISPEGTIHGRAAVLAGIQESYDAHEDFEIEIRNVERVAVTDDHALVRYEEWQTTPDGTNGRLSTALFVPVDPAGTGASSTDNTTQPAATWQHLQETWLDAPD
jgi:hypothetical protein